MVKKMGADWTPARVTGWTPRVAMYKVEQKSDIDRLDGRFTPGQISVSAYALPKPDASLLSNIFHSELVELLVKVDSISQERRRSSVAWLLGLAKQNLVSGLKKLEIRSFLCVLRFDKQTFRALGRSKYLGNLDI